MKPLQYLFIHCTATPEGRDVTAKTILRWHTDPVSKGGRGWDRPGYRGVIRLDGEFEKLIEVNDDDFVQASEVTWGVGPQYNAISHHIVYAGGTDAKGKTKDTRTPAQIKAMEDIVRWYCEQFSSIKVLGHNQVANKACPSFWVPAWLKEIGLEKHASTSDPFGYGKHL